MKKAIWGIIIVLSFTVCCKKPLTYQALIQSSDFPATVGSYWVYQSLDPLNNILDTVTTSVVNGITFNGTPIQRWIYMYSNTKYGTTDTQYVLYTDTAVSYCQDPQFLLINDASLTINFPIKDNTPWHSQVTGITYTTQVQNITMNGMAFNSCAYLNEYSPYSVGSSINESYWIAKGVGIVRHIRNEAGSSYYHLELLSYHIN